MAQAADVSTLKMASKSSVLAFQSCWTTSKKNLFKARMPPPPPLPCVPRQIPTYPLVTAHQFLYGLLPTNIFEGHTITLLILEDLDTILDTIPNQNSVSDQNVTQSHGADLGPNVGVNQ